MANDAYRGIVRYLDYKRALSVGDDGDASGSGSAWKARRHLLLVCKDQEIANKFDQYPSFSMYRMVDVDLSVRNSHPTKYHLQLPKDIFANSRLDTERRAKLR